MFKAKMGWLAGAAVLTAVTAGPSFAAEPAQVQVEHAAARLVVIAEPRTTVSVSISHGANRLPAFSVSQEGGRVIIDGNIRYNENHDGLRCVGGRNVSNAFAVFGHEMTHLRDTRAVIIPGLGKVDVSDLPVITAHVPLDARLASSGAVYGETGAVHSLELATTGCGDWTLGPVQGRLGLAMTGSGDVSGGDVGRLDAQVAGSGDIHLQRTADGAQVRIAGSGDLHADTISGGLKASVAGSGDVIVGEVDGPIQAALAGSGDVRIRGGHAPSVEVASHGSADFVFGGEAGAVQAAALGSGDIRIAHASGPVSQTHTGSSDIQIGR